MKTNFKNQTQETILPKTLINSWEATLVEIARFKGIPRDAGIEDKLAAIFRSEKSNIKSLWEAFTVERHNLPRYLLDPKKQNTSYLLGFHLANCARTWNLLNRTNSRTNFLRECDQYKAIKIFDLGCGTGAIGHTVLAYLQTKKVGTPISSVSLIDTQGPFLDTSRLGYKNLKFSGDIRSKKDRIENTFDMIRSQMKTDELNIVAMGYVWNELEKNPKARRKFFDFMMELSTLPCLFIFLEPANQHIARSAMDLRDELSLAGHQPLYPCISPAPCPMLEKAKDWCYSETSWKQPKLMAAIDKHLEINRSKLKYSGYFFATTALKEKIQKPFENRYPVVGRPVLLGRYNTGFEYLLCKGDELEKIPSKLTGTKVLNRGEFFIKKTKAPREDS